MWVDAPNITTQELHTLTQKYGLNSNITYDVKDKQELSRIELADDDVYVFIRVPILNTVGRVVTHPMLAIVHDRNFFTISTKTTVEPSTVAEYTRPTTTRRGGDLLLGVVAACVAEYELALKHTERSIDDTGSRLRTREITNQDFIHFVVVEDNLTSCRMNLSGILATLGRLKEVTVNLFSKEQLEALDDISLHIQQLLVAVESYAGRVESIRNAYGTVANNTLNQRMQTLTVFTVMIALPNLFYGMYGMNVTGLPFHDQPWGYLFVLVLSLGITLLIFTIAKRLRIF
jgi:magnesium transporter